MRKFIDEIKRNGAEGGIEVRRSKKRREKIEIVRWRTKSKKRWRAEREEVSSFSLY